jgi:integrase
VLDIIQRTVNKKRSRHADIEATALRPVAVPLLDPQRLAPMAQAAVDALLREGDAANTQASYRAALRYWAAWFGLRYGRAIALPVPEAAVLQFIVDHVPRSNKAGLVFDLPEAIDAALVEHGFKGKRGVLALNTVVHRMAVLSKAHTLARVDNPCQAMAVRELMAKTRRAHAKRGALPQRKAALTRELLEALLATCDDSLRGVRDRALLLFAWASGGRRRSEVTSATLENTRKVGEREWIYTLRHAKANQSGVDRPENDKPIVGIAADALEAWLAASGVRAGAIFRRVRKGSTVGEPLSSSAVRDIVMQRCALAGIDGDFSAHSLRSGFVTEAGRRNVPLGDTMAMSGHASVETAMRYYRSGTVSTSRAARLLDEPRSPENEPRHDDPAAPLRTATSTDEAQRR